MDRISMKLAFLVCVFMAASLLASSSVAGIAEGTERKQLFMTGQLCRSHHDCKANSLYTGNFCINKISGSEIGHCVGFGRSTLETELENSKCKKEKHKKKKKQQKKKSKTKPSGCGKCETDEDCRGCPVVAACEKIILNGMCA